jgi:hypothetical protein
MDSAKLTSSAIAAAILFGVYHFVKNPAIKTAALGALGVVIAKNIPYVDVALA